MGQPGENLGLTAQVSQVSIMCYPLLEFPAVLVRKLAYKLQKSGPWGSEILSLSILLPQHLQ